MTNSVAVVTMVYNEPHFLPIWLRYYAKHFGEACCYIVDHGSTDGSTNRLCGANIIRIPRSPLDDRKRGAFISQLCSSLLNWFDTVIYTDVDEFLVPDPEAYSSLDDFCQKNKSPVVWAIGINLYHIASAEPPIEADLPILTQRQWGRFAFAMCKPLVTRVPITWTPGFHSCDHTMKFEPLFLFHLHHYDFPTALDRLSKTRTTPQVDTVADHHHLWPDKRYDEWISAISRLPRREETTFKPDDAYLSTHIQWAMNYVQQNPDKRHTFYFNNGVQINELVRIPERFQACL